MPTKEKPAPGGAGTGSDKAYSRADVNVEGASPFDKSRARQAGGRVFLRDWQERRARAEQKRAEYEARRALWKREAQARGTHTPEQWQRLLDFCGRRCVACGLGEYEWRNNTRWGPLQRDHIWPLAAGGCECIQNIQPLCHPCNATKGARDWGDLRPAGWEAVVLGEAQP